MHGKELEVLLPERLHIELQLFKDPMPHKAKGDIYEASYKIGVFVNDYGILMEDVTDFGMGTVLMK